VGVGPVQRRAVGVVRERIHGSECSPDPRG
jgi:hypothetical protein